MKEEEEVEGEEEEVEGEGPPRLVLMVLTIHWNREL